MENAFQAVYRTYERSLTWAVRHNTLMLGVFFAGLGLTAWLYVIVPKGFIPATDDDQFSVSTEMAQGTSYDTMRVLQDRVASVIIRDPDVESEFSSVGNSGFHGGNNGHMWVTLKPRRDREASADEIINRLRPKISHFPGVRAIAMLPPSIHIGGHGSRSSYEFTLQSPDTNLLYKESVKLEGEIAHLPVVQDVNSDLEVRTPRLTVEVDRDKAAALGLDYSQIEAAMYDAYGPSWASTIYAPQNQFRVMLEVQEPYQAYGDMLSRLYFKSGDGRLIPMNTIAHLKQDAGPQSINHTGQVPSVTVSFNLKPGVSLGQAVDDVQDLANRTLPDTVQTSFSGTAKAFQDSLHNLGLLLLIAVAVVYIVLGVLYESFVHPLTILSGLPSAGFGALLTLLIFKVDLSIYAFVGLIMLIGLVKKNAIMQIDFALDVQRREGKSAEEAIVQGCLIRFRPIMMTTMAALFGTLPIAIALGSGAEARRPLGLAVVGGLLFSQLLTLYQTPVIYTYLDRLAQRLSRQRQPRVEAVGGLSEVRP